MSHFTSMKTRFHHLFYLEKALNRLDIKHDKQTIIHNDYKEKSDNVDIIIPQSNGHNIQFSWNGNEYELVVDMSYWVQDYPIETFIDKIAQQYAGEVIIGESKKLGFQPIKYQQNLDGSNTLILERWKENNF